MSRLMQSVWDRAAAMGIPIAVQFDLTYRCNERCIHCYLDHEDHGELTTDEVKHVLDQLAAEMDTSMDPVVKELQRRALARDGG